MQYEDLVNEADNAGIVVKDNLQFKSNAAGLIKGNHIGLSAKLSSAEKTCVLAEEICHHDLSVGEIYDIRITVNQIMKMALKDDLIYKNPADGVKSKPIKHKEKRALMDTEKKAISRLKKSGVFTPAEQLYIDTLFITGCRPDEALALMKSDVKENVVSVSKALTWRGGKILKDTKSNAGNRKIDVPMWYQKEVDSYDAEGSLYLFHGRDGGLIPENTYKKLWKSIKEKIKNEIKLDTGLVPYIFRHNYVTMLYYSGVSLKEAQRMAGHANASITLEIYSHLDSEKENTAEKIKDFAI